jgi:hypothetical protein
LNGERKIIFIAALILFLAQNYSIIAQFTPEELEERANLEEFLKTAEIIKSEEIGEGVTKPIRLYLKKENTEASGIWKNPKGIQGGFLEGWQYEIAAYQMDKILELNMIPPTVERKFEGKQGSLQLWVEAEFSLLDIMEEKIPMPSSGSDLDNVQKAKYLTRAFDSLIANEDRTQQNIFYTKDWRVILIDHSRSFRSSDNFTKQLMFGRAGIEGNEPFRQLPRAFVEKIKALDFDTIKDAVGPYLQDKEIQAILARKKLILAEIDEMIREKGEENVLY